jgi:hypothetical protein
MLPRYCRAVVYECIYNYVYICIYLYVYVQQMLGRAIEMLYHLKSEVTT